jgi:CheY-like chemotaxis protein
MSKNKDTKELKKIIVVDDLNFHLISVSERLKKYYEVFPALSTEVLFELLDNFIPDLILLDISMPDTDGFETIDMLKTDQRYKDIPVIFLTGKHDKRNAKIAIDSGADDYITKPFKDTDLIECIESQLVDDDAKKKPIVIAVDDSPSVLQEISHAIGDYCTLYVMPEPEGLADLLNNVEPDLILLDYKMPNISGFELVPKIREHPLHAETPILFLTSEG